MNRLRRASPALVACLALAGCGSPESTRVRGGGPGADTQNRPAVIETHAGSRQYYDTPELIPEEAEGTALAPARHAQEVGEAQ